MLGGQRLPEAPDYIVWIAGCGLIIVAITVVAAQIAIANWVRAEAHYQGRSAELWFALGLIGGWVTAVVWLIVRDDDWNPIDQPHEQRPSREQARKSWPRETDE